METILVTGANRGIGLELVKQYCNQNYQVIGTYRNENTSGEFISMSRNLNNLKVYSLDVSSDQSLKDFSSKLGDTPVDIFINNAGVFGPRDSSFNNVDERNWISVFQTNAIAPLLLTQLIIENLRNGSQKKLIYITSKMGSIDDNKSGGAYIYRSSKTALNSVVKSISLDLAKDGMKVALLHPGWVRTDMGGPNGLIDTTKSVSRMTEVIDRLSQSDSGCFFNYDGSKIPW